MKLRLTERKRDVWAVEAAPDLTDEYEMREVRAARISEAWEPLGIVYRNAANLEGSWSVVEVADVWSSLELDGHLREVVTGYGFSLVDAANILRSRRVKRMGRYDA